MSSKQQSHDSDNPFADDDEEDAASSERSVRVAMDRETIVLVAALTDGLGLQKTTIDLVSEKLKKTLTYRELVVDLQVHHQVPKGALLRLVFPDFEALQHMAKKHRQLLPHTAACEDQARTPTRRRSWRSTFVLTSTARWRSSS